MFSNAGKELLAKGKEVKLIVDVLVVSNSEFFTNCQAHEWVMASLT